MLSDNEIIRIIRQYVALEYKEVPSEILPFNNGIASKNYKVILSSTELVARYDYRRNLRTGVMDEVYQKAVRDHGVKVPAAPTYVTEIDGCLLSFRTAISGQCLSDYNVKIKSEIEHYAFMAGEILSNIHAVHVVVSRPFFYNILYDLSDSRWQDIEINGFNHPDKSIAKTAKYLYSYLRSESNFFLAPKFKISLGVIHGDYKYSNLLINDQNQMVVLDWEKANKGSLLLDLGFSLFYFGFGNEHELPNAGIVENFLKGYLVRNIITPKELCLVDKAVIIAAYAFYLLDITFAAKNLIIPKLFDIRREVYFRDFCVPTFQKFERHFSSFKDTIALFLNSVNSSKFE